jgi:hypothetical protein
MMRPGLFDSCAARHTAAKVADVRRRYRLAKALALKQNLEGDERIHSKGSMSIDTAITTASRDYY